MKIKFKKIKVETIFYRLRFWNFIFMTNGKIAPKERDAENHSTGRGLKTPGLQQALKARESGQTRTALWGGVYSHCWLQNECECPE
jgi:hypothetical protein